MTAALEATIGGYFSSSNTTTFDVAAVGVDMTTLLTGDAFNTNFGIELLNDTPNYFQSVCMTADDCVLPDFAPNTRVYEWSGPTDPSLKAKWDLYVIAGQTDDSLMAPFRFSALPVSICPYSVENCVLLSGAEVTSLFGTYCVPKLSSGGLSYVSSATSSLVNVDFGTKIGDLKSSWALILAMSFGSLIISLLFLWILRLCVGVFVWLTVAVAFLLIIFGAILALLYANKCVDQSVFSAAKAINTLSEVSALFTAATVCETGFSIPGEYTRWEVRIVGYILFALAAIYLVVMFLVRKRIKLAIAINKVSSQFVAQNKRIALVPTCQTFVMIAWWALWLAVLVYCVTNVPAGYRNMVSEWTDLTTAITECKSETAVYVADTVAGAPVYRCTETRFVLTWQFWYSIFALFWFNAFLLGAGDMIVAGAVGVWYFTPNHAKATLGNYPLRTGFRNTFVYHCGTLAFGAFVIGCVRILRILFFWASSNKAAAAKRNCAVRCFLATMRCILYVLAKILQFLNKNAFIQTALFGTNFLTSCANAFNLIQRNIVRVGATELVSNLVEFTGLVFISACTGFSGWALLLHFYDGKITSPIVPVAIFCVIGFAIGLITISIFSISSASILICFLADDEMHREEGGAKFTPTLLQRFLVSPEAKEMEVMQNPVVTASAPPVGGQPITIVPPS